MCSVLTSVVFLMLSNAPMTTLPLKLWQFVLQRLNLFFFSPILLSLFFLSTFACLIYCDILYLSITQDVNILHALRDRYHVQHWSKGEKNL